MPSPHSAILGLPPHIQQAVVDRIRQSVPTVQAIYAYGSRIDGLLHAESDLDLALLLAPAMNLPAFDLFLLAGDLEAIAGCPVDLTVLDYNKSTVLCKEVVTTGQLLFVADAAAVAHFEMMTLALYAQLNEERKPVIEAYTLEPAYG